MLTEEKPEAFASPEQNDENGSKKKKKKKKKNNETLPQPDEHLQPQVNSEPLVLTPISEFKSNEEEFAESAKTQTAEIKKKKKKKKEKKIVIIVEESNELKPSSDPPVSTEFENEKEVEKSDVYAEFAKAQTSEKKKRKSKSETGKMGEVVVVENVLNHDLEQVNGIDRRKREKSVQDGAQSNEHNVEPAETAVHISVIDREVSQVKSQPLVVTPISEFKSNEEASAESAKTQTGEIKKKKKKKNKKSVINGDESNENNVERAKTPVQISVADREVSSLDPTIRLNNQPNNEHNVKPAETAVQISAADREVSAVDPTIRLKNQPNNEHNVKPAETAVHISLIDREVSQVKSEPLVVTPISEFKSNEEASAEFAKTQTGEIKKKKKKNKKSVINEEESNEHNVERDETPVQISVVDREVSSVDPTIRLNNQPNNEHNVKPAETAVRISVVNREVSSVGPTNDEHNVELAETAVHISVLDREVSQVNSDPLVITPISEFKSNEEAFAEFTNTQTGEIKKKKKKKKEKKIEVIVEESNEPKPSLDAPVSTEFENKKELEKSDVYAEFAKAQTGEKRKRKSESETGKMGEVVVVENLLNHDSGQVNKIDRRKRQKSVQDGAQSNEHNVEPAETAVQISVVDREVSLVDPTIRLNNLPNNEHNVKPVDTAVRISVLDREVSQVNSEPLVVTPISEFKSNEEACAEFAKTQTGEIKKKKKKKEKKILVIVEESNEPKPSLDTPVSTEFENKKVEKSDVYAEFVKTQTGEKRKRKSKSETGKLGEVVVVENVLNHDSEQGNKIDRRKRQKSVQDVAQSNEHNVELAETAVQISVVDREVSPVDPTIPLNNQPAKERSELYKQRKKKNTKKRKEKKRLDMMMQAESKDELKSTGEGKHISEICGACGEPNHSIKQCQKFRSRSKNEEIGFCGEIGFGHSLGRCSVYIEGEKMQVEGKDKLKSTGEEKTNSEICWACREPNHSIKQCRKLRSLSKHEEICFFCGEIGHSLGKCSVYIAGGGRLARCLFCNLPGHFSYNCPGHNCPGHRYFQGAVAGGS